MYLWGIIYEKMLREGMKLLSNNLSGHEIYLSDNDLDKLI